MSQCESKMSFEELKLQAQCYYSNDGPAKGVTEKMGDILNSMFYDRPADIYGHLANYFEALSCAPVISTLTAREALDGRGLPTLQTEIYCKFKNNIRLMTTALSSYMTLSELLNPEQKLEEDKLRRDHVDAAVHLINAIFSGALCGQDPTNQSCCDIILSNYISERQCEYDAIRAQEKEDAEAEARLTQASPEPAATGPSSPKGKKKGAEKPDKASAKEDKKGSAKTAAAKGKPSLVIAPYVPDEPQEDFYPGCIAVSAVSQAVCQAGASVCDVPLYQHLSKCYALPLEPADSFRMPIPMVTIMSSGKMAPGKLNSVTEFMVVPSPTMSLTQAARAVTQIFAYCAKSMGGASGGGGGGKGAPPPETESVKLRNDLGALCPSFDRAEQGIDLLQEAIVQLEMTPGVDFHIAINCSAHEMWDSTKSKYEPVVGKLCSPEELVVYWKDLLTLYPSVIAIIDPLRRLDKEAWMTLCDAVSPRCYVIGDCVYHRPGRLLFEPFCGDFVTSGAVLRFEHINSVTDLLAAAVILQNACNEIVISVGLGDTTDSFMADLAVACRARFVKLGSLCRGEQTCKFNRLIQIEAELCCLNKLCVPHEHVFLHIIPPPSAEGGPAGDAPPVVAEVPTSPKGQKDKKKPKAEKANAKKKKVPTATLR